jgi:hypothetical protein
MDDYDGIYNCNGVTEQGVTAQICPVIVHFV